MKVLDCCGTNFWLLVGNRRLSSVSSQRQPRAEAKTKKRPNCAVYGCGLSATGALAIPALVHNSSLVTSREVLKPLRINYCNVLGIKQIASGFGFSLFASSEKLYGSGLNNRYQIAGHVRDGPLTDYYIGGKRVGGLPEEVKIVHIAAGRAHSLVIAGSKVYAFGDNNFGQCGQSPSRKREIFVSYGSSLETVLIPCESSPIRVHCTLDSSFVLTADGKIYAFGLNEDGQCGSVSDGIQSHPTPITGDASSEHITTISGSTDTVLALSEKGDVFIWGQNEYLQGGTAYATQVQMSVSRRLPFSLPPMVSAAATATTCAVVSKNGDVFTWGVGLVGLGPNVTRLDRPTAMPQALFDNKPIWRENWCTVLEKKRLLHVKTRFPFEVRRVYGGNVAMVAVNEDGQPFVWGQNSHGLLGLGHEKDQLFPFPVYMQQPVNHISLGPHHSLYCLK